MGVVCGSLYYRRVKGRFVQYCMVLLSDITNLVVD